MQTKDSGAMHMGGFQTWDSQGLTIKNTTFDHNAIYNILLGNNTTDKDVTLTGNSFSPPVYPLDGNANDGQSLGQGWVDLDVGGPNSIDKNWLVSNNSFSPNGMRFRPPSGTIYTNVVVRDNTGGLYNSCPTITGVTYSNNQNCP